MRLTVKLSLLLSGLVAVAIGATLAPLYLAESHHLTQQASERQEAELYQFGQVCARAVAERDEASALGYLRTTLLAWEAGAVSFALYVDAEGAVFVHSDFLHGDDSLRGTVLDGSAFRRGMAAPRGTRQLVTSPNGDAELLSLPVYATDAEGAPQRAGTAFIGYSRRAIASSLSRLQKDSLSRVFDAAVPGLALSLLLAALFGRALTRPIHALGEAAQRVGEGKLDARMPQDRSDELGELARRFNAMAARLSELDELKDSFLAQITHDLRGPLSAIIAYVDVLLAGAHGAVSEKQAKTLGIIASSADYLAELINNILDLTRMEAGRMEFAPAAVDAGALARSVVEMMRGKGEEYGVSLSAGGVAPGSMVWADEQALRRVLANLVSNALKFTPQGGRVSVSLDVKDGADRIAVSDTGIGIPADKVHTLFQKFSQIAETKNKVRDARGTGLGLVICKQIVEAHGGKIWVESVYKQGTTFFFTLPRAPKAAALPLPS